MSEDFTKELPGASPFEKRVLAEFASLRGDVTEVRGGLIQLRAEVAEMRVQQTAMAKNIATLDHRLTSLEEKVDSLEEKVDSRLKETQPIWEAVRAQIEKLDEKFTLFIRDLYDIRGDISLHRKRLDILERRVPT